jgi:spore maturation protein CgeB
MRILILDTYYQAPLDQVYRNRPGLEHRSYAEQLRAVYDLGFARADYLELNLRQLGHEATQFIVDAPALQRRWAAENGIRLPAELSNGYVSALKRLGQRGRGVIRRRVGLSRGGAAAEWELRVVAAQVEQFNPDVILNCDALRFSADFLRRLKSNSRLLVGEISYPIADDIDLHVYDLIISAAPHYVKRFRRLGIRAEALRLGFESSILDRLGPPPSQDGVVFIGALGNHHRHRRRLLEEVSRRVAISCWGSGAESLAPDSPLRQCVQPPLWGYDMYRQLQQARIALNVHIDVAENQAGNMRLYEATGVGTLLITDDKENLRELFSPGQEVVTYRSPDECAELITYYLKHERECAAIAAAGQARTLRDHTYNRRMREFVDLLSPLLHLTGDGRRRIARRM